MKETCCCALQPLQKSVSSGEGGLTLAVWRLVAQGVEQLRKLLWVSICCCITIKVETLCVLRIQLLVTSHLSSTHLQNLQAKSLSTGLSRLVIEPE